jgi:hypothetical protein
MKMPPPPLPTKRSVQRRTDEEPGAVIKPIHPVKTIHAQDDLGFSMTQLESFVEDDLQLTQAE